MATLPASGTLDSTKNIGGGVKAVKTIVKTYDLSTLLAAVLANADVVNLFGLNAGDIVIGNAVEVIGAGTKDATTFTVQLRAGTTAIGAALDATALGATPGTANVALTAAANINLLVAIAGGNVLATKNPTVKVTLVVA